MNDRMDIDDEDEVVQELDVYLAPHAAPTLHLLQFPGRRAHPSSSTQQQADDETLEPISARLKPRHNMLQLDLPLPQSLQPSINDIVTRRFDSQTIPVRTHCCLAQVYEADGGDAVDGARRQQLHLVPLEHIHQMRPNFAHVDASDVEGTGEDDEAASAAALQEESNANKNKPVAFQRKESERAAQARMNTYAFQKASQEAEAWIELQVLPSDVEHQSLTPSSEAAALPDRSIWKADATSVPYVQTLNYGVGNTSSSSSTIGAQAAVADAKAAPTTIITTKATATIDGNTDANSKEYKLELVSKLTAFLKTGSPIPFSVLAIQFPQNNNNNNNTTELSLLSALNVCAVLVRGNWCLHSKFLPRFGKIRTFLLLLLHEDGWIDRRRLWERVYSNGSDTKSKIHSNQLLALLQQIGKRRSDGGPGWVLQIADDGGFVERHPETVALHSAYWARQRQRFQRELALYHGGNNRNNNSEEQ